MLCPFLLYLVPNMALGIPSFTFELGKGRNPLPLSDFESVYKSIEETLVLACVM